MNSLSEVQPKSVEKTSIDMSSWKVWFCGGGVVGAHQDTHIHTMVEIPPLAPVVPHTKTYD
jgi:hypothetical protein